MKPKTINGKIVLSLAQWLCRLRIITRDDLFRTAVKVGYSERMKELGV